MSKKQLTDLFTGKTVYSITHDSDKREWIIILVNSNGIQVCEYHIYDRGLQSRLPNIHIKDFTCENLLEFFIDKAIREGVYGYAR